MVYTVQSYEYIMFKTIWQNNQHYIIVYLSERRSRGLWLWSRPPVIDWQTVTWQN